MKVSEFHEVCVALRDAADAEAAQSFWSAMAEIADLPPANATIAKRFALAPDMKFLEGDQISGHGHIVGDGLRESKPLLELLQATAKPAVVKDLETILMFATPYASYASSAIADAMISSVQATAQPKKKAPEKPLDSERCAEIVAQLEATFGQTEFVAQYDALKNDSSLSLATLREIVRVFVGGKAKSRKEALTRIWEKHQWIVDEHKKAAAMAGRTAA